MSARLDHLSATVTSLLASAGIRTAVAGVDLSFNEDRDHRFHPHWLIHMRVFVPKVLPKRTIDELRGKFPRSISTPRPFHAAAFA